MTTNVLRAPQAIGFRARRLMYIAIGLIAAALVVLAIVSSGGSSTTASTAGRTHGGPAAVGASVLSLSGDDRVPAGSGISFGRGEGPGHEPNLLPK